MAVREKFSWIWLSALIVALGSYFTIISLGMARSASMATQIGLLAGTLGLAATATAAASIFLKLRHGHRGRVGHDERDRSIEHRASAYAYYMLIGGMIVVGCVMPFSNSGWTLVNAALLTIALAEIVHHGCIIVGYRRGWHG